MASRIEQYALIGDTHTVGLVADDGSLDWLCVPRFDSPACFAALLGDESHGRWQLAPVAGGRAVRRRYRDGTLILETEFETAEGSVRVIDFMPLRDGDVDVVRIVEGDPRSRPDAHGAGDPVRLRVDRAVGAAPPGWGSRPSPGPTRSCCAPRCTPTARTCARTPSSRWGRGTGCRSCCRTTRRRIRLPASVDAERALRVTCDWWRRWSGRSTYAGQWAELVSRSAITLKALTYQPTGGLIAAGTTSLPEWIGGVRNWDYRFCWLRDATFSLYALLTLGYEAEARAWREWLVRAVAGSPARMQIMYGPSGERRLTELELDWLPGYEASRPVRTGNAAS